MLNLTDLKPGTNIIFQGNPHILIYCEHSKLGRGGAILRAKLKNLLTGTLIDFTFKGNEKIEEAQISRSKAQFLYKDDEKLHFMNMQDFEQFSLSRNQIGRSGDFLKEGIEVDVLSWNGQPINISLPIKIDLKVAKTEPAVRGNTAQGSVTKPAILETGGKVQVPIFINVGDTIRVNTETGEYVERVK